MYRYVGGRCYYTLLFGTEVWGLQIFGTPESFLLFKFSDRRMLDIISSDEFKVQNPFLNTFAAEKWVEDTVTLFLFWVDGWQLWVFVKKNPGNNLKNCTMKRCEDLHQNWILDCLNYHTHKAQGQCNDIMEYHKLKVPKDILPRSLGKSWMIWRWCDNEMMRVHKKT